MWPTIPLTLSLLFADSAVAQARDARIQARFESECKPAHEALKARFAQIRGERLVEVFSARYDSETAAKVKSYREATSKERASKAEISKIPLPTIPFDRLPKPDVLIRRARNQFAIDGRSYWIKTPEFEEWSFDPATPEKPPTRRGRSFHGAASLGTPDTYAQLTRKLHGGAWVVEDFRKSGPKPGQGQNGLRTLYSIESTPFVEMMEHPSFKILDASAIEDGEEDAVRIQFDYNPGDKNPTRGGWVVLLPDRLWAIRRSEVRYTEPHLVYRSEVDYVPTPGDPTPLRASVLTRIQLSVSTYDNIEYQSTPASEFTLASFGLPEMGRPAPALADESSRADYWVIAAAVACLVGAIVLRRLARRPGEVVAS